MYWSNLLRSNCTVFFLHVNYASLHIMYNSFFSSGLPKGRLWYPSLFVVNNICCKLSLAVVTAIKPQLIFNDL